MSDMLSISSTAVMAYQRALGTVSNNIANVGTEGYSRQDISLVANTPSKQGTVYIGNGVLFDGVKRQVDDFIESNLRNSQSELAAQEPMLSYANRVVDIMGSESTGLATAINQFFAGAQALSTDPSSTILRASFMSDSGSLTSRFRELSGQLESLQAETGQALDSKVGQV
ncbi:MAG: flagellar basal body protein, partial [Burkholderiaceae bacterium]